MEEYSRQIVHIYCCSRAHFAFSVQNYSDRPFPSVCSASTLSEMHFASCTFIHSILNKNPQSSSPLPQIVPLSPVAACMQVTVLESVRSPVQHLVRVPNQLEHFLSEAENLYMQQWARAHLIIVTFSPQTNFLRQNFSTYTLENIARIAIAVQVTICLLVSTSVYQCLLT